MLEELKSKFSNGVQSALESYENDLAKIRTGRANPSLLDGITIEQYGQRQPLQHIARILASDARSLTITPYDPSTIAAINNAIREDLQLGLNPSDDGKVIRIPMPEMTTERRQQFVKQVSGRAEEAKVSLRNTRHDVLDHAKQKQKDSEISQDDSKRFETEISKSLEDANNKIDELAKAKEQEILTV